MPALSHSTEIALRHSTAVALRPTTAPLRRSPRPAPVLVLDEAQLLLARTNIRPRTAVYRLPRQVATAEELGR